MAKNSHSIAKITRPTLPKVFPRDRLFKLLEDGRERPAIWVSGPAGYGKTTLVASYIEARQLPCLWYQIDAGDGDIASFFYYLGLAGKKVAPRVRRPLPLLTPEYGLGIQTFAKRYFEDLFERLKPPAVLVLDNYQESPSDSMLHEIIANSLTVMPPGRQIIIVSRGDPPASFARLLANNQVITIGWEQLRLTPEELSEVMQLQCAGPLPKETFSAVYEKTRGWAAGAVLLCQAVRTEVADAETIRGQQPEKVFDYFSNELFARADAPVRDFLLKTAFVRNFTPKIGGALSGHENAGQILSELNRRNFFIEKRSQPELTYQYHPLFREFLLSRAKKTFSPEAIAAIRRRAAHMLETAGQIEDAVELFRDAGEWKEVTRLILAQAPLMIAQGRGQTMADWIKHLPESICEQTPFLYYWLGISLMPYDPGESLHRLETAFHLFSKKKDPAGIFLSFAGAVESIAHGLHTFKQFDRWISILCKLRTEFKVFPSEEIEARVAMSALLTFCMRQPQHPDHEAWSERAVSLLQTIKDEAKLYIYVALVFYRLLSGELSKAALFINSFREAAQSPGISPLALITLKDLQAFYFWLTANFEECNKTATDALELASSKGVHLMDLFIAGHGAAGALSKGDVETAERFIREMTSRLDRTTVWGKNFYHVIVTWKALLQKDLALALLHAELGLEYSLKVGTPQTAAVSHLGLALVLHELKRIKEASAHISEVHTISRSTNIYQVEFRCLLAEAQFALDRGKKDPPRDLLRKAMAFGREQGYLNSFFWMPSVLAGLCVEALEAGIEVDYVRNLVRKRSLIPDNPPLECENWPWPVKIYMFGRFSLIENDKLLRFSGKARKKPLDMLKAVIALGGREVSEQKITDALWPDAGGDTGSMLFKTTLYRLRQLLVNSKALVVCEGRLTLDNKQCWVDSWAFERMLGNAERIEARGRERNVAGRTGANTSEAVRMMEKAVALYKGHFLEADRNEPWTISLREHLRMGYVHAVSRLGSHWEQERKFEQAADCYQSALQVDDITEEFYQRLMLCYKKLGRKAEAVKTYRRCFSIFKANFGIEPSPETTAIYRSITQ